MAKNKMGRPPKYSDAQQLQEKIDEYFDHGVRTTSQIVGTGNNKREVVIQTPTITGLTLFLGFADRISFYNYEDREEFTYTIKRARTRIEEHYESMLHHNNVTGPIFALKNMKWSDKQEIEHSGKVTIEPKEWIENKH